MTLHVQSIPGLKYLFPDFQNQQLLNFTGYEDDIVFHQCLYDTQMKI